MTLAKSFSLAVRQFPISPAGMTASPYFLGHLRMNPLKSVQQHGRFSFFTHPASLKIQDPNSDHPQYPHSSCCVTDKRGKFKNTCAQEVMGTLILFCYQNSTLHLMRNLQPGMDSNSAAELDSAHKRTLGSQVTQGSANRRAIYPESFTCCLLLSV